MKLWICTNGRPSNGASDLAKAAGFGICVKGGTLTANDIVINWGSSSPLKLLKKPGRVLNEPEAVGIASNKLKAFQRFTEAAIPVPEWTTSKEVAQGWAQNHVVLARTKLSGHSGEGIVIINKGDDVCDAPLYTKYIFKAHEYRVHVVNGQFVDEAKKIRDPQKEVTNWKVRSHANGFIFVRGTVMPSEKRTLLAVNAVNALGLDFGAVDIIEDSKGNLFVLEINTAPGMEGKTLEGYTSGFKTYFA